MIVGAGPSGLTLAQTIAKEGDEVLILEEHPEVGLPQHCTGKMSVNAVKVWLNGRPIAQHNVYHSGSQFDQYVSRVVLEPGRNVILVKVCQNAITPDWADAWGFQLRICDHNGTAVLSTDRAP